MLQQRKRPASTGPSSQQRQQASAKRIKSNQPPPPAAVIADKHSRLITPASAVLSTPSPTPKTVVWPTLLSVQSSVSYPLSVSSPSTASRSAALVTSTGSNVARHKPGGAPSALVSRPNNLSPALSQLQFLLSSAHLTALSAPATSRRLIRAMRHVAAAADIPIAAAVDERCCAACNTLLMPGVSCKPTTRRDVQREERWRRQQTRRRQQREAARHRKHEEQREREEDDKRTTQTVPVQPLTRRQRHRAQQTEERSRRLRQSSAAGAAAGVTFVCSVNVCGHCGHENVLAGTQRKRGGTQAEDVRRRDGADGRQQRSKQKQPATSAAATPTQPHDKADQVRQERRDQRKAQQQTEKLKKQQTMKGGQPTAAQKAAGKAANLGPDPFAGSLFLKFQKPVDQHTNHPHCTANNNAWDVLAVSFSPHLVSDPTRPIVVVSQSKYGLEGVHPTAAARPFSFSHPTAPSASSSTSQPFVHARSSAASASSLTLLDQVVKQKRAAEKEQKRLARLQQPLPAQAQTASTAASGGAGIAGAGLAAGVSLGGGGLYGLFQSFKQ